MASQDKAGMDGMEAIESTQSRGSDLKVASPKTVRYSDFLLRLLALALTLVAVIVLAVAKETKTVHVTVAPNLPPLNIPATAKWQNMSALVYFMVTNAIACAYATLSLVTNRGGKCGMALTLIVLDLVMVALLFSGNGAAGAVGVLGLRGNSHARWNKVCNNFGVYCLRILASIGLSLLGSLVFFLLVVLSVWNLHKKSP
ncbi:hypothetical protein HHK36_012482 [Tetracentron sinense]|uniref:CASP-like protein n=1 Tax=Tetracentron sinense TaxID=13715 RepID=A0A834Z6X0_TETSI|nr:hypothetical protein HHK36_012482 [Tetracentron sinense]